MSDEWVGREPTPESPYYPYRKVVESDTLAGMEQIPYILCRYLMDLPDGNGYTPPSSNRFPRARLKKFLYWDTPLPLEKPLPTPEQIRQLFYDPECPDQPPDPEHGYRIFPQNLVEQSIASSKSQLRIYLGDSREIERFSGGARSGQFITRQDVMFDIIVNAGIESNTGMTASSRSFNMLQCIKEATAGVSFGGIGPLAMRSIAKIDDERYNLGYKMYCYIDWAGDAPNPYFV